jgi:putative PEP-CTERM system TPR-repeat lipoprotein
VSIPVNRILNAFIPALLAITLANDAVSVDTRRQTEATIRKARDITAFTRGIARAQTGQGQKRIADGDFPGAAELLEQAIANDSDYVDSWILLGHVRLLRGDTGGARTAFDAAVKLAPENQVALLMRASLIIDVDEKQAAIDVAAALRQEPGNWSANLLDATIKARHQRWREAEAALMTISTPELIPQALCLLARIHLAQGQIGQADANITHFLALVPGDPNGIALKAQVLMLRGKPSDAVDLLKQTLVANPNDSALLGLLSDAYVRNHQNDEAAKTLDRLSAVAPHEAEFRTQLAQRRIAAGQMDEALAELAIARAAAPLLVKATALTLQVLITENRLDEATKATEALRREAPDSPLPETYLGLIAMARSDIPAAREHLVKALASQPDFAMAAIALTKAYRLERRTDDARAVFDRFLRRDPRNMAILMARAELEAGDGKDDAALAFLQRARSSDPQALQPRLDLVAAYIKRNEPASALSIGHELTSIAPRDPRAFAALAEAQLANNDRQTAIQTFGRLVEMTDGAPEALVRLAEVLSAGGDIQGAYRTTRRALDGNPADLAVQKAFYEFSVKHGMIAASIEVVRGVLIRRPNDPNLDLLLGHLYESDRQYVRAAAAYEAGLGNRESSDFALGIARAEAQGPKPARALATLASWLEKHPDDGAARFYYSNLLTEAKQFDQAIAECEKLRIAEPKNPIFLNNLAWLYFLKSDSRAMSTADEAFALAPDSTTIADTLGWILVQNDAVPRGLQLLRRAAAGSPKADTRYRLAVALSRAGLRDDALRVLTELIGSGAQFDDLGAARDLMVKLGG